MKKNVILVTGFEPFGNDNINPTQIIVNGLPSHIDNFDIVGVILPVEFINAPLKAINIINEINPQAIIMLGQAGGRNSISVEYIAKNIMNARIPDNNNYQPLNIPVIEGGKDELYSTLPIEDIVDSINKLNIPINKSIDSGTYVCNALFYQILNNNKKMNPVGFIHVPYIPSQGHNDLPSLPLEDITNAVMEIIRVVIRNLNR